MGARGPSSFFLKKKNQKFKATQPGAKSSANSYLQFEAVGTEQAFLSFCTTRQIAFCSIRIERFYMLFSELS